MLSHDFAARYAPEAAFLSVFAASIGVPFPAFATLVLIGASLSLVDAASSTWGLGVAIAAAVLGGLLGDLVWFLGGRRYGDRTLRTICQLTMSRDSCVTKTERFYGRWGARILIFARFVPGLSLVSVPLAGAMRVEVPAFLWRDAVGLLIWASVAICIGPLIAPQLDAIVSTIAGANTSAVAGVAAVLIVACVAYRHWRRQSLLRLYSTHRILVHELYKLMAEDVATKVFDVRSAEKRKIDPYAIKGSTLADETALLDMAAMFVPDQKVVIYCSSPNDVTAATIASELRSRGVQAARVLTGGLAAWREAGFGVVKLNGPGIA
ncbi:VTT domain-containing protein [Variovorax sp. dw_308]|uniref:VTT domain-containing protein n=1 Tax=Variovorax sp. dw_308 TaxID=2721546 RepID=UPI001C49777B